MGMTTYVRGIKPPDETWLKMKAVWNACDEAGVPIPVRVVDYFDHQPPDEGGVEVRLDDSLAVTPYTADGVAGIEVDLSKLPDDVTILRFINSW